MLYRDITSQKYIDVYFISIHLFLYLISPTIHFETAISITVFKTITLNALVNSHLVSYSFMLNICKGKQTETQTTNVVFHVYTQFHFIFHELDIE